MKFGVLPNLTLAKKRRKEKEKKKSVSLNPANGRKQNSLGQMCICALKMLYQSIVHLYVAVFLVPLCISSAYQISWYHHASLTCLSDFLVSLCISDLNIRLSDYHFSLHSRALMFCI